MSVAAVLLFVFTIAVPLFVFTSIYTTSAVKVVCYYCAFSIAYNNEGQVLPEDLDPKLCTHINYAFVYINESGHLYPAHENIDIADDGYKRVTSLKEKNSNLKVLLSIGGGNASPQTFSEVAADPAKRATMVASARSFMEKYNFDGIDLDWEIPRSVDRSNFVTLLEEFKNDFNQNGWLVTAAVAADVSKGYDVARISQILDHINVMTYDMYGPWSAYTGQNSPLYSSSIESNWQKANLNMDAAISQWINAGASPDKVIAGIAFYGRSYTLADPNNNGLHAPFTGPGKGGPVRKASGVWIYLELCEMINSWSCRWDDKQKNPICVNGNQWLGTDNEKSIREKVKYINSKKLGGAMIWAIDQDDVHGHCGDSQPLLKIIADNVL